MRVGTGIGSGFRIGALVALGTLLPGCGFLASNLSAPDLATETVQAGCSAEPVEVMLGYLLNRGDGRLVLADVNTANSGVRLVEPESVGDGGAATWTPVTLHNVRRFGDFPLPVDTSPLYVFGGKATVSTRYLGPATSGWSADSGSAVVLVMPMAVESGDGGTDDAGKVSVSLPVVDGAVIVNWGCQRTALEADEFQGTITTWDGTTEGGVPVSTDLRSIPLADFVGAVAKAARNG